MPCNFGQDTAALDAAVNKPLVVNGFDNRLPQKREVEPWRIFVDDDFHVVFGGHNFRYASRKKHVQIYRAWKKKREKLLCSNFINFYPFELIFIRWVGDI